MAKDGFSWLVNVVEEETDFPELSIWAIVPGGLIAGTLVSEKRFDEYGEQMRSARSVSLEEGILRTEMSMVSKEILDKYPEDNSNGHVEACLINVQLFSGGVVMGPERVRLRISEVAAWGLDTIPNVMARMRAAKKEPAS